MNNQIMQQGNVSVHVGDGKVTVNGVEFPKPRSFFGNSVVQNNNTLYVNGWRFNGKGFEKPSLFRRLFGCLID